MFSRLFDSLPVESDFVAREARAERERFREESRRSGSRGLLAWQVNEGILPPEAADRLEREFRRFERSERRAARGGDPSYRETDDIG